jgi:hypothetical protein
MVAVEVAVAAKRSEGSAVRALARSGVVSATETDCVLPEVANKTSSRQHQKQFKNLFIQHALRIGKLIHYAS